MDAPLQRFAFLFLLILLCPLSARGAADATIYAVHGVAVDASADTAAAARDKAIVQGARKGLEQLLRNLTGADEKSLTAISDKTAGPLVIDFEVESERRSATRYIASMGFRYKPDGVKALLATIKAHPVERAPAVLVVPVYRSATGDLLWQPENPWRAVWKDADKRTGLVPVIVPTGTPEDMAMFSGKDLDDAAKLAELAANYKADNAVIVIASAVSVTGQPGEGMNITLSSGGGPDTSFKSPGAATPALALDQGVTATLAALDTIWRQQSQKGTIGAVAFRTANPATSTAASDASPDAPAPEAEKPPSGNQYALRATLTSPGQWSALRGQLGQLNGLSHLELKSLSREAAIVTVYVAGNEDRMAKILADGGLLLGSPQAIPSSSGDIASMVPVTGPGAGLIYPISATERPQ